MVIWVRNNNYGNNKLKINIWIKNEIQCIQGETEQTIKQ